MHTLRESRCLQPPSLRRARPAHVQALTPAMSFLGDLLGASLSWGCSLHNTKVTGDLSRLSRLSRLTELRLHETGVKARKAKRSSGGDTGVFSDLEDLTRLTVTSPLFRVNLLF